jgi:hypothetical protein
LLLEILAGLWGSKLKLEGDWQMPKKTVRELINSDLINPHLDRRVVIQEILKRESRGQVDDINDLVLVLRRAPDECKGSVLERVKKRATQLNNSHWHTFIRICGPDAKDWAEHNRVYFDKKQEEESGTSRVLQPEAIPA